MTAVASGPKKPTRDEVRSFLRSHSALIVHFSGTPKGAGSAFEYQFPLDLKAVIDGRAQTGLSASIVKPGDEFDDLVKAHATGCIGVVLDLISPNSLVAVSPSDCGSTVIDGVRTVLKETEISFADLQRSLADRGKSGGHFYNEWVVRNFRVLGIFAAWPYRVMEKDPPWPEDSDVPECLRGNRGWMPREISIETIVNAFQGMPVWSFGEGGLVRQDAGAPCPVDHSDIYAE